MSQFPNFINKNILVDAGFWIAFYTRDNDHEEATKIADEIWQTKILIPWPTLYEFLRTKFVKDSSLIKSFEHDVKSLSIDYIDDGPYKDEALRQTLSMSSAGKWSISLVDSIIRNIIDDETKKIDYLVTFNKKDFADVCARRRVPFYYPDQGF